MNLFEIFFKFLILFLKYSSLYCFFYFSGKSFDKLLDKLFFKNLNTRDTLLNINKFYLFPIIGLIFIGNILIILNFFVPLNSLIVYFFILLIPVASINKIKFSLDKVNIHKFIYFVFIPSVLLISSSDINFHYDSAYYHLNHQNWLRESNLIIGMVNIFWPFGMSSIYEYLSSILWFDGSYILIHFLSLLFIHFLFICLYYFIFESKNKFLTNSALLIIIFGLLDNFGFGGGRNGFLYIQEAGKQDTAVASLTIFITITLFNLIKREIYNSKELTYILLISFFVFQIKVSSVYVFIPILIYIFQILYIKKVKLKTVIFNTIPVLFFGILWFTKSFLTTGCLVFPVSLTCIETLSWYRVGSTKFIEEYTTQTSFAFMEYFQNNDLGFSDWFNDFFFNNGGFSEYYRNVYSNFLISLSILVVFCLIYFKRQKNGHFFNISMFVFIVFGFLYLIFYGPIPRYSAGLLSSIIGLLGFYFSEPRLKESKTLYLIIFIFVIGLIPRLNSYKKFLNENDIAITVEYLNQNQSIKQNMEWTTPKNGDKCWIDLNCRVDEYPVGFKKGSLFKTATTKVD